MPEKIITVSFKVSGETIARVKDKENLLLAFSNLDADDQKRMTEIMTSKEALKGLKDNWSFLKSFIK